MPLKACVLPDFGGRCPKAGMAVQRESKRKVVIASFIDCGNSYMTCMNLRRVAWKVNFDGIACLKGFQEVKKLNGIVLR